MQRFQKQHPLGLTRSDPAYNCHPFLVVGLVRLSSLPTQNTFEPQHLGLAADVACGQRLQEMGSSPKSTRLGAPSVAGGGCSALCHSPAVRVWLYLTEMSGVKTAWCFSPFSFLGKQCMERCASASYCLWQPLESDFVSDLLARVCVWCVGARTALETVFFDFYKMFEMLLEMLWL